MTTSLPIQPATVAATLRTMNAAHLVASAPQPDVVGDGIRGPALEAGLDLDQAAQPAPPRIGWATIGVMTSS